MKKMQEIDFNQELDFVDGEGSDDVFKQQLVTVLRQANSAEDMMESAILEDLVGDIARSEGAIEVSEKDLEVLEDNFNRIMQNDDSQLPNWLTGTLGKLIRGAREELEDDE